MDVVARIVGGFPVVALACPGFPFEMMSCSLPCVGCLCCFGALDPEANGREDIDAISDEFAVDEQGGVSKVTVRVGKVAASIAFANGVGVDEQVGKEVEFDVQEDGEED